MERIAVIAVALSVAVMILAVAVMDGFREEVTEKMSSLEGHVVLSDIRSISSSVAHPVTASPALEELVRTTEGFRAMAPFAATAGIVRTDESVEGVILKGIDRQYDTAKLRDWTIEGSLPRIGDTIRTKDAMISRSMAAKLRLGVGDRMEILFVGEDSAPYRDRFKVSGIYTSGMEEMESRVMITDIRNVQRILQWENDLISGYEIFTESIDAAPEFALNLDTALLYDQSDDNENIAAASLQERYPNPFGWLQAMDVNTAVIIVIMLVVALFNMTTSLLITVLERTRMIGTLKALGMTNGQLRRLFLYRAALIALRGLAWGNGAGLALCAAQRWGHIVKLDAEGYLLSEVPIALDFEWWLLLNIGFMVAIVVLMIVPTHIVSTIKPAEAIRYE